MASQPTSSREPSSLVGTVTTRHLEGKIVETAYDGRTTAEQINTLRRDLEPHLRQNPGMRWLVDALRLTGYENTRGNAARDFLIALKQGGCERIGVALRSPAVRMLALAVSMLSPIPLRVFATREEALAYLREDRR